MFIHIYVQKYIYFILNDLIFFFFVLLMSCMSTMLLRLYFFTAVLGSQHNRREGTEISHRLSAPIAHAVLTPRPPLSMSPPERDTLNGGAYADISSSPKARSSHWVHSRRCAFYRFRQTCNDAYPSPWCHAEYFHRPKILRALPIHPSLGPRPLQPLIFSLSPQQFAFSGASHDWDHRVCGFFRLASFAKR